jgi:hypothetical protein
MQSMKIYYHGTNRVNRCGRSQKAYCVIRSGRSVIWQWGRTRPNGRFAHLPQERIKHYGSELEAKMQYYRKLCEKFAGKRVQGRGYRKLFS